MGKCFFETHKTICCKILQAKVASLLSWEGLQGLGLACRGRLVMGTAGIKPDQATC
jgi:hypothetical protein